MLPSNAQSQQLSGAELSRRGFLTATTLAAAGAALPSRRRTRQRTDGRPLLAMSHKLAARPRG